VRVAVYSPLPPARSGIADYTAELLPELARHVELEIVVEPGQELAPEVASWPRRAVDDLGGAVARGEVDLVLYHVGNSAEYHERIRETALELPGVVVLHDYVLHHLVRGIAERRRDPGLWLRELAACYGAGGERAGRRALASGVPLDPFRWPLFESLVDRSLALLVHSEHARARVLAARPHAEVAVVPMPACLAKPPVGRAEARRRLGLGALDPEAPLLGLFGHVNPAKRPQVVLRAFARLRERFPAARLVVAGEISPHFPGGAEIARAPGVTVLGRLALDRFLLAMEAVDVAVNLRFPVAGETSGALVRLLGLGTPVVVSDAGSFAEIPDGCCAKVPLDASEEEVLVATLAALLADPSLRAAMGGNARRYAAEHHALAASARGYAELLARVAAGAGARPGPAAAEVPLPSEQLLGERLVASLGRTLADLGVDDGDEETLGAVAAAVAAVGWGPPR